MATLAEQQIVYTGLAPAYVAAAAGGDTFANDGSGRQFLHVKNADGVATRTVTVSAVVATTNKSGFNPLDVDDIVVVVPISGERMIGPIELTAYGSTPDITYDDESDVTIGLFKA